MSSESIRMDGAWTHGLVVCTKWFANVDTVSRETKGVLANCKTLNESTASHNTLQTAQHVQV